MSEPIIELNNIGKSFKVAKRRAGLKEALKAFFKREHHIVEALHDISFKVYPKEIVGYIGPNGAGKSTTIKVMSGILVPDEGKCLIAGYVPWVDRQQYVSSIGVVFGQRSQLWWDVPVIDSFELLRDIYKLEQQQYLTTLNELTVLLKLEDILNTPVRQLSLGQRMRCEIAASLIHSPKILFLDEPTIGLDADSKIAVRSIIKRLNVEQGITVILTTHDMSDIEALADRIMMIGKGRLLYDGSLTELKQQYGTAKTLKLNYEGHFSDQTIEGLQLVEQTEQRLTFLINSEQISVTEVIARLGSQINIKDMTVESTPVDELIVKLYREHQL